MESIQKGTLNRNFNPDDSSSCCVCRITVVKGTPTTVPNNLWSQNVDTYLQ